MILLCVLTFLILWVGVIYYMIPGEKSTKKIVTIDKEPEYGRYRTKGSKGNPSIFIYYVSFKFRELSDDFLCSGLNYNYFRHDFLTEISVGDTAEIEIVDKEIKQLKHDNRYYVDILRRNYHKDSEINLVMITMISGLIACLALLLANRFISIRHYLPLLNYSMIIIWIFMIAVFFTFKIYSNFQILSSDYTYYPKMTK